MKLKLFNYIKNKEYNLIRDKYGIFIYDIVTPKNYKKMYDMEISKYKKENKYIDLSLKYPYAVNYLECLKADFEYETGQKLNINNYFKYKLYPSNKYALKKVLLTSLLTGSMLFLAMDYNQRGKYSLISMSIASTYWTVGNIKSHNVVEEYDDEIRKDLAQYDFSQLSEKEVLLFAMHYVRSNTYYDRNTTKDYNCGTNYRLSLKENDNHGVCRHIADKYTEVIKIIRPDLEPVNMVVNLDATAPLDKCDIHGLEDRFGKKEKVLATDSYFTPIGNHLVTVIKSQEYDCYLVIDSTNPSIGVLDNGNIYMINNDLTNSMNYASYGQYFLYPFNGYTKVNCYMIDSYFSDIDYDTLKYDLSLKEQNRLVKKIRQKGLFKKKYK